MAKIRFMYLWQHPNWPLFRWDDSRLAPLLAQARLSQGRMLGIASQLQLLDLGQLQLHEWTREAAATAEIEGDVLPLHSVRASIARRLGLPDAKPTHRDVRTEATLDVIEAALQQSQQPLSHDMLWAWQAALFPTGYSGIQRISTGQYRQHAEPMQIITPRLGQPDVVHYEAPPSRTVYTHMQALLDWCNHRADHVDGLLRAGILHLWFELIHPFEDGNGRVGRALLEHALARDSGQGLRIWSLSAQIQADLRGYYGTLQTTCQQDHLDITVWLQWWLQCVKQATTTTLTHIEQAQNKTRFWHALRSQHPDLHPSQEKALNKLFEVGDTGFSNGLSTEKYVNLTRVSRATAYRELTDLVAKGLLRQSGQGRGTRYHLVHTTTER